MQTLFEAANQIAQEIERTRQHLANLEQALAGLKPLIGIEPATTALVYAAPPVAQTVEDVSVVQARVINAETVKPKLNHAKEKASAKAKLPKPVQRKSAKTLPATGAEFWLSCFGRKNLGLEELLDAASQKLELDDAGRAAMKNRANAWIYSAVRKGSLKLAGSRDGRKLYQRVRA